MYIKSMGWNTETECITNTVLLITELYITQLKDTSDHSELRLLNLQQRKEWGERNPGMQVTEWRHDMKHREAPGRQRIWHILCCTLFLVGGK